MGYTLSFDASEKCTRAAVGGLLRHIARDVDQENGCEVQHSNPDIDSSRTPENRTLVADGHGGWMVCTDTQQIADVLDARLSHVKKPLRKDAVVLRPLIVQMDPEWYDEHKDEIERQGVAAAMTLWAADTFGAENLIYCSLHNDEGSPHLHIGFCPVTSDGRLAQKDWFPGPSRLHQMHDDFRQHMRDAGYDVDMKRKKPGKHAKRMTVEEYKDFAALQDEKDAADEYARTTRHNADQGAKETVEQAQRDAKKILAAAQTKADAALAAVRVKIQQEIDDAQKERDGVRAALQGDLETWQGLTPNPSANALLGVLGAAARASMDKRPVTSHVGDLARQMRALYERQQAREQIPGPTHVEGPTR